MRLSGGINALVRRVLRKDCDSVAETENFITHESGWLLYPCRIVCHKQHHTRDKTGFCWSSVNFMETKQIGLIIYFQDPKTDCPILVLQVSINITKRVPALEFFDAF